VFVLGLTACAFGGGIATGDVPPRRTPRMMVLGLHGPAAVLITFIVWVTGSAAMLAALVALVALMWLFARVHHVLMPPDNGPPAPVPSRRQPGQRTCRYRARTRVSGAEGQRRPAHRARLPRRQDTDGQ
jgi:hypothetical protein